MSDRCENCGKEVGAAFCGHCGQTVASIDLPVADFARDMASEALGLDSRVRRTLGPLLFRPGHVPTEYVAGHRASFVPPFRLYLMASLVMFLVLSLGDLNVVTTNDQAPASVSVNTSAEAAPDSTAGNEEQTRLSARISDGIDRIVEEPERFREMFVGNLSRAMFVLLPLFALLLKLAWWKRLYVHHFIFAIYFHAFAFIVTAIAGAPDALGLTTVGQWTEFLLLWIPIHLVLSVKRFYETGWFGAIGKSVLIYAGYGVVGGAFVGLALLLSLLTF